MPYLVNGQIGLVIVNVTTQEKSGFLHILKQEKGMHKFYDKIYKLVHVLTFMFQVNMQRV